MQKKDMEYFFGMMGINTKDSGKKESKTDMGLYLGIMEINMGFGVMVK